MYELIGKIVQLASGERHRVEGAELVIDGDLQLRRPGWNYLVGWRWHHVSELREVK